MGNNNLLLKVLLVDDEPLIRRGLAALFDWESEGFYIAGEASNGKNAIQLLKEREFDVIICDIKMPEMDGIEFITYMKEHNLSKARFIFLSGFYDFQYAKTAIKCNCCDYILKPIQKEELLNVLRKIANEYRMELGDLKIRTDCEKAFLDRNLLPILWGKFDCINIKNVQEKICLSDEISYIHVEISLKDERFISLPEEKKREEQRKLYQYTSYILKNYSDHIIFDAVKYSECYDIGILYCSYMGKEKNNSMEEWVGWLANELKERLSYRVEAIAGSCVNRLDAISDSYREATMARFFYFQRKNDSKMTSWKDNNPMKGKQDCYLKKEIDHLIHAIEICDRSKIMEYGNLIYSSIMDRHTDMEVVGLNLQYFIYQILGLAYEQEAQINQDEIIQCIWDAISINNKEQGSKLKLIKFAEEFADYLKQLRQNTAKGVFSHIEKYIEENYAEDISLKSIGEIFYINSAYLGQLFKKQYGCAFKDYLNNLRIRKAADLMLRTDRKVYEIAEDVGYKNLEYFITKFEGIYGATPKRFRKSNISC
jgi:two-component system response regulator YesN